MTGLLSAISGKFNVSLVLGTVLPVTIFTIVARLLLAPVWPGAFDLPFVQESEVFTLSLVILLVSGLFYHLDTAHIRLYEGYPWRKTAVGRWKRRRLESRVEVLVAKRSGLRAVRERLRATLPGFTDAEHALAKQRARDTEGSVRGALHRRYPSPSLLLPTRLGNMIRSAEDYPDRTYGIAGVTVWPRLVSQIPAAYASTIENSKARFDFTLHSATLSAVVGGLVAIVGLLRPSVLLKDSSWLQWGVEIGVLALVSVWFYEQSVDRAAAWGNTIRSAFDLYRGDLLEQLGYRRTPASAKAEKSLWDDISWRMVFGYEPGISYAPSSPPATAVVAAEDVDLRVLRTVLPLSGRTLAVAVHIQNRSSRPATGLVLTDSVPAGYDLVSQTAWTDSGEVEVSGANPYRFELSDELAPGAIRGVAYQIHARVPDRQSADGGVG